MKTLAPQVHRHRMKQFRVRPLSRARGWTTQGLQITADPAPLLLPWLGKRLGHEPQAPGLHFPSELTEGLSLPGEGPCHHLAQGEWASARQTGARVSQIHGHLL